MNKLFTFAKDRLLSGMKLYFNMAHGRSFTVSEHTVTEEEDRAIIKYTFSFEELYLSCLEVRARMAEDAVIFSIEATRDFIVCAVRGFVAERALSFDFCCDLVPEAIFASSHEGAAWMLPSHPKRVCDIPEETQFLTLLYEGTSYCVLPLCGENFRCEVFGDRLSLSSGAGGLFSLSGDFLAVAADENPLKAVKKCYSGARSGGAVKVPLREERPYPKVFERFGWCTWDSFYHDVTSEKIYRKLEEFNELGVPVKWVIIDDGWSSFCNRQLTSFEEDRTKFPEGLGECIYNMKSLYGVEKVGVWVALGGYWSGIVEGSPVYCEQQENLCHTPCGMIVPAPDEAKAYTFWDTWLSYLEECGVDFIKLDNQSSLGARLEGMGPTVVSVRAVHRAVERSAQEHFDGEMLNCMGMDMENVLSRPYSAVSRSSDDFYPERSRGFVKHMLQNVYNAVWHGCIYHCDFDMWWSCHESAVQNGVLRAVSGSPVYVSDPVGMTRPESIRPVIEDDGELMRCDGPALPTLDCFYRDVPEQDGVMKIWNRSGDSFVLALFNLTEAEVQCTADLDFIPEIDKRREYVGHEYFSKKYHLLKHGKRIPVTIGGDGVAVFSLYPVYEEDGVRFADLGDSAKYAPVASRKKLKTALDGIFG